MDVKFKREYIRPVRLARRRTRRQAVILEQAGLIRVQAYLRDMAGWPASETHTERGQGFASALRVMQRHVEELLRET